MKKRIIFLLLICFSWFYTYAVVTDEEVLINGIYYSLYSDGSAAVTSGPDFGSYAGSVKIPSAVTYQGKKYAVTCIGAESFAYCQNLTSVSIPSSVELIGFNAFNGCSALSSITISEGVTKIVNQAFYGCSSLRIVELPSTITEVGAYAFSDCKQLTKIILPQRTKLGEGAFDDCPSDLQFSYYAPSTNINNTLCQGALPGVFTVGGGKKVRFSQGNLQYTQSTKTWSFAAHQYDMIGYGNVTGGSVRSNPFFGEYKYGNALADKIDLFGWSGSTAVAKWGVSISQEDGFYEDEYGYIEDYYDEESNAYSGDFADWGQNAISNGGNKANRWRTLTSAEWLYLIKGRPNASSLQGVASVNGVNGLILLPDGWKQPAGIPFKSGFAETRSNTAYGVYQSFTSSEWQRMESAGAVFLPASGRRRGTDVLHVGDYGRYWSATPSYESDASYLSFYSDEAGMDGYVRYNGQAVRLVRDVK